MTIISNPILEKEIVRGNRQYLLLLGDNCWVRFRPIHGSWSADRYNGRYFGRGILKEKGSSIVVPKEFT